MKKYLFILISLISLTAHAQWTMHSEMLFENTEGVLCLGKIGSNSRLPLVTTDSLPLAYRDTILSDGTPSRLYSLPPHSALSEKPDHFFIYWLFPDGVRILLHKDSTSFLYPSGLQPGLHNLVSNRIEVMRENHDNPNRAGIIGFEYLNAPKQDSPYSKPYPRRDCEYKGTSMFAKVKVIGFDEYCKTERFYVRVIENNSDTKADFDVYPVVNQRWGTECAQWQWVDSGEDFCVTFGFGGDFTIRIIDK